MSTYSRKIESVSQKITAILIGAGLAVYAVVFAVQGRRLVPRLNPTPTNSTQIPSEGSFP